MIENAHPLSHRLKRSKLLARFLSVCELHRRQRNERGCGKVNTIGNRQSRTESRTRRACAASQKPQMDSALPMLRTHAASIAKELSKVAADAAAARVGVEASFDRQLAALEHARRALLEEIDDREATFTARLEKDAVDVDKRIEQALSVNALASTSAAPSPSPSPSAVTMDSAALLLQDWEVDAKFQASFYLVHVPPLLPLTGAVFGNIASGRSAAALFAELDPVLEIDPVLSEKRGARHVVIQLDIRAFNRWTTSWTKTECSELLHDLAARAQVFVIPCSREDCGTSMGRDWFARTLKLSCPELKAAGIRISDLTPRVCEANDGITRIAWSVPFVHVSATDATAYARLVQGGTFAVFLDEGGRTISRIARKGWQASAELAGLLF